MIVLCDRQFAPINQILSFQRRVEFVVLIAPLTVWRQIAISVMLHFYVTDNIPTPEQFPICRLSFPIFTKSFWNDLYCIVKIWPSIIFLVKNWPFYAWLSRQLLKVVGKFSKWTIHQLSLDIHTSVFGLCKKIEGIRQGDPLSNIVHHESTKSSFNLPRTYCGAWYNNLLAVSDKTLQRVKPDVTI